jgi:hypothetical protein
VTVDGWVVDEFDFVTACFTITNNSSEPSNYVITVEIVEAMVCASLKRSRWLMQYGPARPPRLTRLGSMICPVQARAPVLPLSADG